jgi:hypothetical protein
MKTGLLLSVLISLTIAGISFAQVPASQDTIVIPGDIPHSAIQHAGALETTINGDTTNAGARINPNRVYALQEGHFYYQNAAINVTNPGGILTIVGVPDSAGTTKPVILRQPIGGVEVGANEVYGSIKIANIHYQAQQLDGYTSAELFVCGTANQGPQSLTLDNCLFEFCNLDLFDCTNESGAIGGWPYGAKFFITNCYFRNMFNGTQWWGSRVFQCKHPIDTLWVENNTIVGGGLTFLQQNELTDFAYFNHNTIVNNTKYWLLSVFYRSLFITNNIFINQNWVGIDTNEIRSNNGPRTEYQSTIDIDSVDAAEGVVVQPKYYTSLNPVTYSPLLALNKLQVFVSNNVNYYDTMLINGYYNTTPGTYDTTSYPLSYLGWFYIGAYRVENIPCEWMNTRTQGLFKAYGPGNGGFIEEHTTTLNPQTATPGIADASVVVLMAKWNQNQYSDPRFPVAPDILHSKYITGDYDPTTIPGRDVHGNKTENGSGITSFTDLTENFGQSSMISTNDGFPIGSLIWNDAAKAAFATAHPSEWNTIYSKYVSGGGLVLVDGRPKTGVAAVYSLGQNYPNPFNPATVISYQLAVSSHVTLKVYDILGREVTTLVDENKSAGSYLVKFDGSRCASGIYFYRMESLSFSAVKKFVLMK